MKNKNADRRLKQRSAGKYVVPDGTIDYRTMAKIMSEKGFQMNHATARNQFVFAMNKLMTFCVTEMNPKLTPKEVTDTTKLIINDTDLQEVIGDFIGYIWQLENETDV